MFFNRRIIFLDLDGVFADFDKAFREWFGVDHKTMDDDKMWKIIHNHPTFFLDLPLTEGGLDFFEKIKHFEPIILTACNKDNYAPMARQKRQWVRNQLHSDIMVLPVLGGKNKALFMHSPGDILIDDFSRNTKAWEDEGGISILHKNFPDTEKKLFEILQSNG